MDELVEFLCAACGLSLCGPVRELRDPRHLCDDGGAEYLPAGAFVVEEAGRGPRALVNLRDLRNTRHVADPRRLNGCCGLDGMDGPNVECVNGHAVGTEHSDCWCPHYLDFEPGAVTRRAAAGAV